MAPDETPLYTERLWPGALVWGTTAFFTLAVGIAILPASLPVAVGSSLTILVVGIVLAWVTTPLVTVSARELRAGRARIPIDQLGDPQELDPLETSVALGPDLDARAFVCLRAWARTAVRVPVTDPRDPAPYWLVSTRHPAKLAAALRMAQETTTATPPA